MATSSRPYHHGDLRPALVEAALELSRGSGQSSVSLREVTRQVGVSPAAAYRHFRDRTELMAAVAREIQEKMATRMRRRMRASADAPPEQRALQRLRGVGLGYIAFAVDEPGWFETAFFGSARESELRERADGPGPGGGAEDAPPPFVLLTSALDECVQAGVLSAQRRPGAEFVCWSAVHGCAELVLHGPLRGAPRKTVREIAERVVDDVITGVRRG
ncbi:MAG TPA: WHG domain-containing protein [Candidatus Brachybacterium merdavium]|uniref:WHG domain-containing protein n=1 Tax=Candidatus Brachybacterium merdavium TaxID=2838513 RepID=A0A9D2LB87_9MICO|nr:WHG domain-containing protein [Candidatus Brachybacterium merdavium]